MYSLVSPSVLGFDLVRSEDGSPVAHLLERVLTLTPADLGVLAGAYVDAPSHREARDRALQLAAARPRLAQVLRPALGAAADGLVGAAYDVLVGSGLGSPVHLVHLVRHDILDWTWERTGGVATRTSTAARAESVVTDALLAASLTHELPAGDRAQLAGPWRAAAQGLPGRVADLGPQGEQIRAALRCLTRLPADLVLGALGGDDGGPRVPGSWSADVHEATWAAHLTGRLRVAASAQLRLVEVVLGLGLDPGVLAEHAWQQLSGAVQAMVVTDVLEDATATRLTAPLRRVLDAAPAVPA